MIGAAPPSAANPTFRRYGQPAPFHIYQRAQIWSSAGVVQSLVCGGSCFGVFLEAILSQGEMIPIVRIGLLRTQFRSDSQVVFRARIVSAFELHDPQGGAGKRWQGCLVRFYRHRCRLLRKRTQIDQPQRTAGVSFDFGDLLSTMLVGVAQAVGQDLGCEHESDDVVRVERQDFSAGRQHLGHVVFLSILAHGFGIKIGPQVACRILAAKSPAAFSNAAPSLIA